MKINHVQTKTILAHSMFAIQSMLFGYIFSIVSIIFTWCLLNIVISLYIHRIRCHNNFKVSNNIHKIGSFIFSGLNLGAPDVYVGVHIKHHRESGNDNDPHDPYKRGFWNILTSNFDEKFLPDRKTLKKQWQLYGKYYFKHHEKITNLFIILVPVLPMLAFWHSKFVLIVTHIKNLGYKNYHLEGDTSENIWWLKPLLWGEELHNNHHAKWVQPNHNHNKTLKEFDLLYFIGCMISQK